MCDTIKSNTVTTAKFQMDLVYHWMSAPLIAVVLFIRSQLHTEELLIFKFDLAFLNIIGWLNLGLTLPHNKGSMEIIFVFGHSKVKLFLLIEYNL